MKCRSLPRRKYLRVSAHIWRRGLAKASGGKCAALKNQSERQRTTPFPITIIKGGRPETRFEVVQNIYANETSYAQQQREAARQFRMIAREVMT